MAENTYDENDKVGIVLGDPDLPNEIRRYLYDKAVEKYGEIEGGYESIKILTAAEAANEYLELKRETDPIFKGLNRANKIFEFINSAEGNDVFLNLENLNEFLDEKPIDSYVLMKLIALVVKQESKAKASFASKIRHIDTYALKAEAIEYWLKHIDPKLSNPKAADLLIKIVPVSHRKLAEYVAEAKRENIHPAS